MNEDHNKLRMGTSAKGTQKFGWISYWVKPSGKYWKRYFNKKVRKGLRHKRGNWFEWS